MPPTLVIEIAPDQEADVPTELISAAYQASASAFVVFVMSQTARPIVDRLLDPLVADWGLSACGIRYLTMSDESLLGPVLGRASWAMVESQALRAMCETRDVLQLDASSALARLKSMAPVRAPRASGPSYSPTWVPSEATA